MESFVEDVCKKFDLRYEIAHQSEPALCDKKIMQFISESCGDLKSIEMPHEHHMMHRTLLGVRWV